MVLSPALVCLQFGHLNRVPANLEVPSFKKPRLAPSFG